MQVDGKSGKKLILHIGCEKTGSTSIQKFFRINRPLLEKAGFYYPTVLGLENHTKLAIYASNADNKLRQFIKEKDREIYRDLDSLLKEEIERTSANTVVMSNEWLHSRLQATNEFSKLKLLLSSIFESIQVHMYIRKQDDVACSLYSTAMKSGQSFPFPIPYGKPYYYNYNSIFDNWSKAFGMANVFVHIYEKGCLEHGDVVHDFCKVIGLEDLSHFTMPTLENTAFTDEGLKVIREFNKSNQGMPENLRKLKMAELSEKFKGSNSLLDKHKDELAGFVEKYAEDNQLLANKLGRAKLFEDST
ncbi:hypothetical protein PN836_001105 [Ningiella sp. W23]|uniref:hypothetical protein n=1 Tax=Ningiella sp. W23 TaxID=3023715 RepID=UPI003756A4F4